MAALEDANGAIVLGLDGAHVFAETTAAARPRPWRRQAMASRRKSGITWRSRIGAGKLTLWVDGVEAGSQPTHGAGDRR